MNLASVKAVLEAQKQPSYRMGQLVRAFYAEGMASWEGMTTFPKELRAALMEAVPWNVLTEIKTQVSREGDTVKTLFQCADGKNIETVLMRHEGGRNTVCVSSQVGCAMKCSFCATGTMGLTRNLTTDEIVEQVVHFSRWLKPQEQRVTNVVFMGMGEPMHNYDQVMAACRLMNSPEGLDIGARHLSISTCGIVPGIRKLTQEKLQVNLAISLHSAIDETRTSIMPVNRPYPLKELMKAVDEYTEKTNRKVFFEYLLLKGINDTPAQAKALAELLQHNYRLFHVNLIKYHNTQAFEGTSKDSRLTFMQMLQELGVPVTHRITFGEDIDAACGQLAVKEAESGVVQGQEAIRVAREHVGTNIASTGEIDIRRVDSGRDSV